MQDLRFVVGHPEHAVTKCAKQISHPPSGMAVINMKTRAATARRTPAAYCALTFLALKHLYVTRSSYAVLFLKMLRPFMRHVSCAHLNEILLAIFRVAFPDRGFMAFRIFRATLPVIFPHVLSHALFILLMPS